MRTYVILISILLVTLIRCEIVYLPEEVKLLNQNFLQKANPGDITITLNCQDQSEFVNAKAKTDPQQVTKGQPINVKILGNSKVDEHIIRLEVAAFLDGQQVFTDKADKNDNIKTGEDYVYSYTTAVPTFVPQGIFEIRLNLINDKSTAISCLKATFQF